MRRIKKGRLREKVAGRSRARAHAPGNAEALIKAVASWLRARDRAAIWGLCGKARVILGDLGPDGRRELFAVERIS